MYYIVLCQCFGVATSYGFWLALTIQKCHKQLILGQGEDVRCLICNSELGSVSSSPALCIFWRIKVLETTDSVLVVCNLLDTIMSLFTHITTLGIRCSGIHTHMADLSLCISENGHLRTLSCIPSTSAWVSGNSLSSWMQTYLIMYNWCFFVFSCY
jgi:hypothetical protein